MGRVKEQGSPASSILGPRAREGQKTALRVSVRTEGNPEEK